MDVKILKRYFWNLLLVIFSAALLWHFFRLYQEGDIWNAILSIGFALIALTAIFVLRSQLKPIAKIILQVLLLIAIPVALIAVLVVFYFGAKTQDGSSDIPWVQYSAEALARHRAEGEPVFLAFTAKWCGICRINEAYIIETPEVANTLTRLQITPMKADWTDTGEEIGKALHSFGGAGVPLYVMLGKNNAPPEILHNRLKQSILLNALEKAGASETLDKK